MQNGFVAKSCNFQGVPGYMLEQYYNGRVVCSQFLPESSFTYFCKVAGIKPIIEEQAEYIRLFRLLFFLAWVIMDISIKSPIWANKGATSAPKIGRA